MRLGYENNWYYTNLDGNTERTMKTTLTVKGQVTIPKHIRHSLNLEPGCKLLFDVNEKGELVLKKSAPDEEHGPDRFDEVAGTADIKWRTDELMALLRGDD